MRKNKMFDNSLEFTVCWAVYNRFFNKFHKCQYDLIMSGYLGILENVKNKNVDKLGLTSDEKFRYYYNYALGAMSKYINSQHYDDNISLFTPLSKINEHSFVDVISDYSVDYFDDSNFILDECSRLLKSFDLQNQKILRDYIFNGLNMKEIYQRYKLNKIKLCSLVRDFRSRLIDILDNKGISLKNNLQDSDEFTKILQAKQRLKDKQNGVNSFDSPNNYKIYDLLRDMPSLTEIANCLNIDEKRLKKILNSYHGSNTGAKLYLYQIQKLRLKYFQNYSLQQLVAVGG